MHTHFFPLVFHRFVWPSVTGKRCVFISQADKPTPLISLMRGMRIRYRGTHATQKWDISFMRTDQPSLVVFKRWQTLSLYAALIYATEYEMNVLNPWWWRPRGQLINRVHARVYIETQDRDDVYCLCTATTNHCDNKHSSVWRRWFWYHQDQHLRFLSRPKGFADGWIVCVCT